ncbi:bifunctional protein-serine/threonine kinase/phosphatase [Coraliomargarita sp. SDUM461003]|uniref:Bifunctional protein-serine/threonine kinase/phosphatase n=1 Tax=Thalassobacterium maritimum TaxID=3041265 RepID=A0ABU1AVH8_9BACT|nr:bifunctional protein-serine/threonine kinase/phosphatase [Coraliomargarita sp. SDUM461003]MDQ8208152.1 bifunctional protein-serine/threonine kinase/phosphatase [Coraliomargarita sp. SDUM461003]
MQITPELSVRYGQATSAGVKAQNDDCLGVRIPRDSSLGSKGVAMILADGVSSAEAGREAAEICVQGFLSDYYSTPDTWQVKTAGHRVIVAINSWLYGKGQAFAEARKGFVCAMSGLVLKSHSLHYFHVGDTRIYLWRSGHLEQLTQDHRAWVSQKTSYLARAMGLGMNLDVDYRRVQIEVGDVIFTCSDGVHEFVCDRELAAIIAAGRSDLDASCESILTQALAAGSSDNVSCQLLEIVGLQDITAAEVYQELGRLPFPPPLSPGMCLDGYVVQSILDESPRSQLYLVQAPQSEQLLVMKTPSELYNDHPAYIERFLIEEWVGRRISSPNLVQVVEKHAAPKFLYYLMEHVEGATLVDWMREHPQPEMGQVLDIIQQIVAGLRALHRKETLHQDLKPDNIIIDVNGVVKIIDYGSVAVAGLKESEVPFMRQAELGTKRYSAPEYTLGRRPSTTSDLFSLGVIAYQLFGGGAGHPYGDKMEAAQSVRDFSLLKYRSVTLDNPLVPHWIDSALAKAVHLHPENRYQALSEMLTDLQQPNPDFLGPEGLPLLERNPLVFWQALSGGLALVILLLVVKILMS